MHHFCLEFIYFPTIRNIVDVLCTSMYKLTLFWRAAETTVKHCCPSCFGLNGSHDWISWLKMHHCFQKLQFSESYNLKKIFSYSSTLESICKNLNFQMTKFILWMEWPKQRNKNMFLTTVYYNLRLFPQ